MKRSNIVTIACLSVALFVVGCVGQSPSANSGELKDFTLNDLSGQKVNFKQLVSSKKAVLLNFWATWCPPCREEIPGLVSLQKKYEAEGFTVLGVSIGESHKKVSNFAKKMGMNYPVLLDSDQKVGESYQIVGIPTSYLYDSTGALVGEYHAYTPELVADIQKTLSRS